MREIKFRMWNNVKHDSSKSKYFYDVEAVMECLKQQINFNNGKSVRFEHTCYDHVGDGCFFEQFTGLTDKNGKEIYEGDVVVSGIVKQQSTVKFIDGSFTFVYDHHSTCARHFDIKDVEVIGNIHENPELK